MSPPIRSVAPPTAKEKKTLRAAGAPFAKLGRMNEGEIGELTGISPERSRALRSLSLLQGLRSVGPSLSAKLLTLGYDSLEALAKGDPHRMYRALCSLYGRRVDPCVEDVFRCAVAQARHPDMNPKYRDWWLWTEHRGRSDVPHPGR